MFWFKLKVWLTSGLKTILFSFALFSFQGTTWFLKRHSLEATCLLYLVSFGVSSTFSISFSIFSLASQGSLLLKETVSLLAVPVSDLYYDTRSRMVCQQLFWKSFSFFFSPFWLPPKKQKGTAEAVPVFHHGRGSWTRTNACGIQNPVPYQLGDTPVSPALRLSTNSIIYYAPKGVNTRFRLFSIFLWKNHKKYVILILTICSSVMYRIN